MGAQYIHGAKKNPIYELCSQLGMVDKCKRNRQWFYKFYIFLN